MAGAAPILGYRAVPMILTLPATGVLSLGDDMVLRGLLAELVTIQDQLATADPHWVHSDYFSTRLMEARQWLTDHNIPQFTHVVVYSPQESLAALAVPDPSFHGPNGPTISMRSSLPRMRASLLDEIQVTPPSLPVPTNRSPAMFNFVPGNPRAPGVTPFYPFVPGMFPSVPVPFNPSVPVLPVGPTVPVLPVGPNVPVLPVGPSVSTSAVSSARVLPTVVIAPLPPSIPQAPRLAVPLLPAPTPVLPSLPLPLLPLLLPPPPPPPVQPVQPLNLSVWSPMSR
jgi:hypothetical protein